MQNEVQIAEHAVELVKAVEYFRSLEWCDRAAIDPNYDHSALEAACPDCGKRKSIGHASTCGLNAALEAAETAVRGVMEGLLRRVRG